MSLEQKDLELIERIIYKNGDDIAVSIGRSFERLEERIDTAESRIYNRLIEIEEKIESGKDDMTDVMSGVREDLHSIGRAKVDDHVEQNEESLGEWE